MKTPLRPIYKEKFKEVLTECVMIHKRIGFPSDHPKWLQLMATFYEKDEIPIEYNGNILTEDEMLEQKRATLLFKNSNSKFHFWFAIDDATEEEIYFMSFHYQKAYEYFRALKYEILEELNYSDDKLKNQYKYKIK